MSEVILFVIYFLQVYRFIIFIYILLSWFPNFRESSLYRIFYNITDPYLEKFRNIIPPIGGMIDISPIIGILLLEFAIRGLIYLL